VTLTILQVSSVPLIPLKVAGVKVIWVWTRHLLQLVRWTSLRGS
jgi:hypothetical protein